MARFRIVALLTVTIVTLCRATDNVCPEYGYYRVANPRSKTSFYVCNNGQPNLNYCPNGHYFDRQSADCVAAGGSGQSQGGSNNRDYARNQRSNYNEDNYRNSRSNSANNGKYQPSQYSQSNNYNSQGSDQNTRSSQQNGYGNSVQQQSSRSYQQNGYDNNAQQQNTRSNQQNGYNRNSQQQNSYSRSQTQNTQQSSSDLEMDPEVNKQNQDRLRQGTNNIERVICPLVITENAVLMPNDEDQSSYYVCQRSGARRLLRCPVGTKFNVGMKKCMSSSVSTTSANVRRQQTVTEHW